MIKRRLKIEQLERRLPLAADFGDAPAPYDTLLADNGASHEAVGPMLGATRDAELDGLPSIDADGDGADDDGLTFGTIRIGQLGATVTVNVQSAPTGAKLDAWIDFNGDGSWSGASEQIANNVSVVEGDNVVEFDVPVGIVSGTTFARFRISTAGNLNVTGAAADGEVEDYLVEISPSRPTLGFMPGEHTIDVSQAGGSTLHAADLDGDHDQDLLLGTGYGIYWLEQDSSGGFVEHTIATSLVVTSSITTADIDRDGDLDIVATVFANSQLIWFENDGSNTFVRRDIATPLADPVSAQVVDLDQDGDLDIVSGSPAAIIAWYENNGSQTFTERTIVSNTFGPDGVYTVYPVDMDRDGDLDLVVGADGFFGEFAWYENNGAQQFTERVIPPNRKPAAIYPIDFDRDGDLDIVYAINDSSTDSIGYLANDGSQGFSLRVITYDVVEPATLDVADINGDGELDLLVGSTSRQSLHLFSSDGRGGFIKSTLADTTNDYYLTNDANTIADMDGDGDLDVIAAGNQRKVYWFESHPSNSSATATPQAIVEDSGLAATILFSRTQNISAEETFNFEVLGSATFGVDYSVAGATSFTASTGSVTFLAGQSTASITVTPIADGDFEWDETVRIRFANYADIGLPEQENNPTDAVITILHDEPSDFGDAPDSFHTTTANSGAAHGASGPRLGAMRDSETDGQPTTAADGDGADDDGVTFGTIRTGQQDATVTVNVQNAPAGARLDAWFDFDDDGNFSGAWEQVVTNLALVEGDNAVPIDIPATIGSGQVVARFRLSTAGGLQSLGYSVDGEVEDYVVTILPPATSDGVFSTRPPISTTAITAADVFAADLDGDGDVDVISASRGGSIDWYENDGTGQFIAHNVATFAHSTNAVKSIDLDRDGDLDLLAALSGAFVWYKNDGDQNFIQMPLTGYLPSAEEVDAADMDGDGDLDIVAFAGQSGITGKVVWFENDGAQNFSQMIPIADTENTLAFALGDIDGDGHIDIVTATTLPFPSSSFPSITVLRNDGTGHFSSSFRSAPLPRIASLAITDLDGDGDSDIVFAFTGPAIYWLENLGAGVFDTSLVALNGIGDLAATKIVPTDVDGDGHINLLATGGTTHKAYWYKNDGATDPTFTRIEIGATGRTPWAIFPGDLDGDGDLDVVTASRTDNRIEWFENIAANSGDFDGDGDVDGRDFLAWQRGQSPTPLSANDLADWRATYGYVSPAPEIVAPLVDEPADEAAPFVDSESPTTNASTMMLPKANPLTSASRDSKYVEPSVSHERVLDKFFGELGRPTPSYVRDFGDIAVSRLARKRIPLALSAEAFED